MSLTPRDKKKSGKKKRRPVELEEEDPEDEELDEEDSEDEDAENEEDDVAADATEKFGSSDVDDSLFPDAGDADEADEIWADGIDETARGKPLGDWIGEIHTAELTRSASSGKLMIKYQLKVVTGESTGVKVWKYDGLGSPQQSSITQGQLQRIGINPAKYDMKTLPGALLSLAGVRVAVNAKQNGDFYNIFFQRVVTEDAVEQGRDREKLRTRQPPTANDSRRTTGRRKL